MYHTQAADIQRTAMLQEGGELRAMQQQVQQLKQQLAEAQAQHALATSSHQQQVAKLQEELDTGRVSAWQDHPCHSGGPVMHMQTCCCAAHVDIDVAALLAAFWCVLCPASAC